MTTPAISMTTPAHAANHGTGHYIMVRAIISSGNPLIDWRCWRHIFWACLLGVRIKELLTINIGFKFKKKIVSALLTFSSYSFLFMWLLKFTIHVNPTVLYSCESYSLYCSRIWWLVREAITATTHPAMCVCIYRGGVTGKQPAAKRLICLVFNAGGPLKPRGKS